MTSRLGAALIAVFSTFTPMAHAQSAANEQSASSAVDMASLWRSLPALRPTPLSDRTNDLARTVVELQRQGLSSEAIAERAAGLGQQLFGPRPELSEAMQQAYRENPDLLRAMRERYAEVFALNYTDAELEATITMATHPVGRIVQRKQLDAIGGPSPTYTPEEQAWIDEFEGGEIGRAIRAKKMQVSMTLGLASMEFAEEMSARTRAIYCERHACSDAEKTRVRQMPKR